jgi:hypothetical protein
MTDQVQSSSAATEQPATREYVLRAMARNYKPGNSWDHLDAEACIQAANEIKALRDRIAALEARGVLAPAQAVSEPVAWRIKTPTGYIRDIWDNKEEAEREVDGYWRGTIEPLYAAPVQSCSAGTADADVLAHLRVTMQQHGIDAALEDAAEEIARLRAVPQEARKPADIKSIAAIIDPSAWKMEDGFIVEQSHSDESIRKAEAILESLRVGDLVDALRTIGELEPLRQVGDGTYDFAPRLGAAQSCALARKVLGISSSVTRPHGGGAA